MSNALRFDDQVMTVTGAGGGFGRAHALLFAKYDVRVVVSDLGGSIHGKDASASATDKVVAEVRAAGGTAVTSHDSVTDDGRIVENALDAFGRVDVVANNVGILRDKAFHKMEDADWDLVYRVHVEGTYKVTRAAWPHLHEQAYGRVVFTFLTSGIYGDFDQSNYGMTRLGLYDLIRTLAPEGREDNILVNTIIPTGSTQTTKRLIPSQVFERLKPELVSLLVAHLGSSAREDTSGFYEVGGDWIDKVHQECSLDFDFDLKVGFSAEDVVTHWRQIRDSENAVYPADSVEALREMMANLQKHTPQDARRIRRGRGERTKVRTG